MLTKGITKLNSRLVHTIWSFLLSHLLVHRLRAFHDENVINMQQLTLILLYQFVHLDINRAHHKRFYLILNDTQRFKSLSYVLCHNLSICKIIFIVSKTNIISCSKWLILMSITWGSIAECYWVSYIFQN